MKAIPKHLYPFESNFFDLDGLRYHYLDEGPAPETESPGTPVVMVHGNPTWSFYYRRLVLSLREHQRCIVPDHIGCGLSDKPSDDEYDYHFQRRVEDLGRLIDGLGLEKVQLVLHDWGGMIGMAWAVENIERVEKVVLLNTAAFHLPSDKPFPKPLALARNSRLGAVLVRRFNAFSRVASHVCCKKAPLSEEVREAYCAPYDNYETRIATLRFVQDIPLRPGDRGYELITAVQNKLALFEDKPVMIGWGEQDFVFDVHFLRHWQKLLPNAQVYSFADYGHYILEDAWEELEPRIKEFLE